MNITFREDTHQYCLDDHPVPSVTQIIKEAGLSDYSSVPAPVLSAACKFGTAVHRATELWDKGTLDIASLSVPLLPYLEAWKKFRMEYNPEIKGIELRLASKAWKYAGTIDRHIAIEGNDCVLDIKTGFEFIPATAIQLAGYALMVRENTDTRKLSRMGILLKPDATYKIQQYKDPSDEQTFLSALICYRFKEKHNLLKKEKHNDQTVTQCA